VRDVTGPSLLTPDSARTQFPLEVPIFFRIRAGRCGLARETKSEAPVTGENAETLRPVIERIPLGKQS
jgi:hypothetical protein